MKDEALDTPRPLPMEPAEGGEGPDLPDVDCALASRLSECVSELASQVFDLRCRSPWLTIGEAENYAHVRHGVLREAVRSGEIESYRRPGGSATIVRTHKVDEWIERTWESGKRREGEL